MSDNKTYGNVRPFNTVLEGNRNWGGTSRDLYKMVRLDIPGGMDVVASDCIVYHLYGFADAPNFKTIRKRNGASKKRGGITIPDSDEIFDIKSSLRNMEGLVLDKKDRNILYGRVENPVSFMMDDGRVFMLTSTLRDEDYVKGLERGLVIDGGTMFSLPEYQEMYKTAVMRMRKAGRERGVLAKIA